MSLGFKRLKWSTILLAAISYKCKVNIYRPKILMLTPGLPHYTYNSYVHTYLLTYSTEESPSWEANRFAASQEIPHILWNPKVHHLTHKCPPSVPILSQLDPVHTPTSHFLKINLNIILPSASGSLKRSLSLRFPHQNPVHASPLPHTRYMSFQSHNNNNY